MTREIDFHFIDVFARRPLTGNPLALVPDADGLDETQLRAVAREFNQSETTFLLPPTRPGAQVRLRSFTAAGVEVGGAGHNALGAWLWLGRTGRVDTGRQFQEIGTDLLAVDVAFDDAGEVRVSMDQTAPSFQTVDTGDSALATALGVEVVDLDAARVSQVVSTGVAHLLVAVRNRAVVDRVAPDQRALHALLAVAGGEGCYVYTTDATDGAHAYARFFNPTVGITEDPATGTAAGPLAAALVRDGTVPDGTDVVVDQGHAAGRPSRLVVHVAGDLITLSGSGVVVGSGRLTV